MVRAGFLIPCVKRRFLNFSGDAGFVVVSDIKARVLLLFHRELAVRPFNFQIALEYGEVGNLARGIDAEMSGALERNLFVREIEREIVFPRPVHIGHAINQIDFGDALARIA